MSNIPIEIGPYEVLQSAEQVLRDHLPTALLAYGTAHGFVLDPPMEYWQYQDVRRDWQSPGVGLNLSAGVPVLYSALGAKDVEYAMEVLVIIRLSNVIDPDPQNLDEKDQNYYRKAVRDYCDAIGKTLETYMPANEYASTSYVWNCILTQPVGQIVFDATKTGDMLVASSIQLGITQRVRSRTPIPVTPVPVTP